MGADDDATKSDPPIFDNSRLKHLTEGLGISIHDPRVPDFHTQLELLAQEHDAIVRETPFSFSHSPFHAPIKRRIKWLQQNAIDPANALLDALSKDNMPYFSDWPNDGQPIGVFDWSELARDLDKFNSHVKKLKEHLLVYDGEDRSRNDLTTEFRYSLVYSLLVLIRDHFEEVPFSRGTHDTVHGTTGRLQSFVREAFKEITGDHEKLDRAISESIVYFER